MKRYICLLALALVCCKGNESKIVLTSGLDENPEVLRYGIEINNLGDLYYCEETKAGSGEYNYFHSEIEQKSFDDIQLLIYNNFKNSEKGEILVDDKMYYLKANLEDSNIDLLFQLNSLNTNQVEAINKLEYFKKNKMQKIKYHDFPKRLLTYKLPIPPAPKVTNN
jgi:hypothetical protein